MKKIYLSLLMILLSTPVWAADNIAGLWTTIDDESGDEKSVVQIYDYQGKMYGRVVKLFKNPQAKAKNIKGNPLVLGLDIIWGLEDKGDKFDGGKILDPTKGKIYSCEAHVEGDNLILRGKIGPFGRNQTWRKNTDTNLAVKNPVPQIPEKE